MAKELSKGRDITRKEKIEIAQKVCDLYATGDYTLKECLRKNGIKSDTTWSNWKSQIGEIGEAYIEAKKQSQKTYNIQLEKKADTMLEKWITGFDDEEEKIFMEKKGNRWVEVKKIVTKKKKHSLKAIELAKGIVAKDKETEAKETIEGAKVVNINFVTPERRSGEEDEYN